MSKSPKIGKFDIKFYIQKDEDNTEYAVLDVSDAPNKYKRLFFLNMFDKVEIEHFLYNLALIESNQPFDPNFIYTTGTEGTNIEFSNLDFIIEGEKISVDDLRQVLEEWLSFKIDVEKRHNFNSLLKRMLSFLK